MTSKEQMRTVTEGGEAAGSPEPAAAASSGYGGSSDRARRALARKTPRWFGRPRFLVVLTAAAAGWVFREALTMFTTSGPYAHDWMGWRFTGDPAYISAFIRFGLYGAGAYGLWMMRPWARLGGIVYLAGVLAASMLWWKPAGYGTQHAAFAILRQISVIPLVTFCMMYLYREERLFRGVTAARNANTGPAGSQQ